MVEIGPDFSKEKTNRTHCHMSFTAFYVVHWAFIYQTLRASVQNVAESVLYSVRYFR